MWFGFAKTRHRLQREVPRHLKAGRRYFAQKEYQSALAEYNQALHTAPQLAEAYCRRGFVYQAMGQTEHARNDFDQAILYDPRLALAYLQRGKMLTESGDLDGALADFGQLMVIQANDPDTYLHRGICLVKKGLLSDALADFHRVLKLTNHSDFAEPAKAYIRQLEDRASSSLPSAANGESALPSSPRPRAQDHAI
jgi:tetratricopeptide (TPR) repeat protein